MGMQTDSAPIPEYLVTLVDNLRRHLLDPAFIAQHRVRPQDFTRDRILPFALTLLFVLQHTVKSLQRHLHEFLYQLQAELGFRSTTPSAVTQARAKLKSTAFIILNQACVVPARYESSQAPPIIRWHGWRVLAVDGSTLRLPMWADTAQAFGVVEITNQTGGIVARYPEARISVLFDVRNRMGLEALIESSQISEVDLAKVHLLAMKAEDVVLWDRGYTGYILLALSLQLKRQFVGRCSSGSFAAVQALFQANQAGISQRVWLRAPKEHHPLCESLGLPRAIEVRLVTLRLPTGELEVLVTSLLDEQAYPTSEFGVLYHYRWGIETYYFLLKSRLNLENFSGKTAESIRQDFHAAVLLANLESLLTEPTQAQLPPVVAPTDYRQQVNRADAYHALKLLLLDLLYRSIPAPQVLASLQQWFAANPVRIKPDRQMGRTVPSFHRSDHFQRRVKKAVF